MSLMSENDAAAITVQADLTARAPSGAGAIRVLYVEDNRLNALLFEEALRAVSYTHLTLPTIYSV